MQIKKLDEAGYRSALLGLSFSYVVECDVEDCIYDFARIKKRSEMLCKKDSGHNKFLEQIQTWYIIRAPLYWWKQFDTYRVGVSKSSKSTMHTIIKKEFERSDFSLDVSSATIKYLESLRRNKFFDLLNAELPNGYLQTRLVNINYKTLRNIIKQRKNHKLTEWEQFIDIILLTVNRPELLE
jgi:hypothetical protein